MAITFEGGRFSDTNRNWQANEEAAVTGWDKATAGIFALGIGSTTHNGDTVKPELRWRNRTDAGPWTVLGAAGEVKYAATTALTDESDLLTTNFGTSSGAKTAVNGVSCEQEDSGTATSATSLAKSEFTELQVGISFADGDPGDEYEFALYESGGQIGISTATVTLDTGGVVVTPSPVSSVALAIIGVVILGSVTVAPAPSSAIAERVAPAVVISGGGESVTPGPVSAVSASVDPATVLGSMSVTPLESSTIGVTINPMVVIDTNVTPGPSTAVTLSVDPTTVLGSLNITPTETSVIATTVEPAVVKGAITVTPTPASVIGACIDPTVTISEVILNPFVPRVVRDTFVSKAGSDARRASAVKHSSNFKVVKR
jgi:hypothetical protein